MTVLRRLSCPLGRLGGSVASHNTVGTEETGRILVAPKRRRFSTMAVVAAFHSIREAEKPDAARRHHNTDTCELGRNIPEDERREGTGDYQLCEDCAEA